MCHQVNTITQHNHNVHTSDYFYSNLYINTSTVTSRLSAHFGSQGFWSDKRNVRISETPYYTWNQAGSHIKS